MPELGLLLVGIIGLWIGTQLTVDMAVEIAKTFNFSQTFIGLTILAFGTDLLKQSEPSIACDGDHQCQ